MNVDDYSFVNGAAKICMKVCQSDMYLQWKTKVHHEKDDLMKIH